MRTAENEAVKVYVEKVYGRKKRLGLTNADLMRAMRITSATTLKKKLRDPGTMTVREWMMLNNLLGLRAELS